MRLAAMTVFLLGAGLLHAQSDQAKRLEQAATVFSEVMEIADKAIPQDLLDRAQCIVVVPG
ncbi:MAG: hypothetical protein EHM65_09505, partial [Acidobacteriales bacterium]